MTFSFTLIGQSDLNTVSDNMMRLQYFKKMVHEEADYISRVTIINPKFQN